MFAMHGNPLGQLDKINRLSLQKRRYCARLNQKKFRDQEKKFLAEGLRAVLELIKAIPDESMLEMIVVSDAFQSLHQIEPGLLDKLYLAEEKDFKAISNTIHSQGICAVFKQPVYNFSILLKQLADKPKSLIVVCDGLQDPGNAGTILRTCAWFDVDLFICGENTVDVYNPKTVRASAGSLMAMPICQNVSLKNDLETIKESGFTVFAAALEGEEVYGIKRSQRSVLVIGNEGVGVSEELKKIAHHKISIPGNSNAVESLNASVSAGILISIFST